jgi:hypothetical protein
MSLINELLTTLPDGEVWDVRVGVFWTAVAVEVEGHRQGVRLSDYAERMNNERC